MSRLESRLADWLAHDLSRIGEVQIEVVNGDSYRLYHFEDSGRADLQEYEGSEAARQIAADDDQGESRPLKTAPSLQHGWQLKLNSLSELRLALDYLYPGIVALAAAQQDGHLEPTPLRETLNRQTGMYRITATVDTETADRVVAQNCALSNCRRRILWPLEDGRPLTEPAAEKFGDQVVEQQWFNGQIPLICREACCLLVGAIRQEVKRARADTPQSK